MFAERRSFILKKNKTAAAEVRQQLMQGNYLLHNLTEYHPNQDDTHADKVQLSDNYGQPVDIESILSSRAIARTEINQNNNSSPQRLRDVIEKDVELCVIPRLNYIAPNTIFQLGNNKLEPHIRHLLASYEQDFSVVEHKFEKFGSAETYAKVIAERAQLSDLIPKHVFESDFMDSQQNCSQASKTQRGTSQIDLKRFSTVSVDSNSSVYSKEEVYGMSALNNSISDPVISSILNPTNQSAQPKTAQKEVAKAKDCQYLINLLTPQDKTNVIERRTRPKLPTLTTSKRLSIKVLQLSLNPSFEPIFASMALFDTKAKKKISENFYFDFNSNETLQYLRQKQTLEEANLFRQALFPVGESAAGLYLIIRLEKVLQGSDTSEAVEPYLKEEKDLAKLRHSAWESCTRLGRYRMPMGWIAIDLQAIIENAYSLHTCTSLTNSVIKVSADEDCQSDIFGQSMDDDTLSVISADRYSCMTSTETFQKVSSSTAVFSQENLNFVGTSNTLPRKTTTEKMCSKIKAPINLERKSWMELLHSIQPLVVNVNSFYKQEYEKLMDEELIKAIANGKKHGHSKASKLKHFPVELKLELEAVDLQAVASSSTIVSSELLKVGESSACKPKARDMLLFSRPADFAVNTFYRNLLYVYPKFVNLSTRAGNARNIAIKIELMDPKMNAVCAIFGKSREPSLMAKYYTSVSYHTRSPQFMDEVKIQLPVDLSDGHHLLFTFYHIVCKAVKAGESIENAVGYTWIPLYKDGQLQSEDFSLPISLDALPQGICYLSPMVNMPNVKWLDGHKCVFNVTLSAVSTIHPQDQHLSNLFQAYNSLKSASPVSESELNMAIRNVVKCRPEPMVAFLYTIVHKLVTLMASPYSENTTRSCFETLCQLVKIGTMLLDGNFDEHGRSQLLITFIYYYKITSNEYFQTNNLNQQQNNESPTARNSARDSENLLKLINNYEKSNSTKLLTSTDEISLDESNRKLLHEEVMQQFVNSTGAVRETACLYSWFFFELVLKAMAEYLATCNRFFLPRKLRFRETFLQNIREITMDLTSEIIERTVKDFRQSKSLNCSLAFFFRDALLLMDRSFIIGLIKSYNDKMASKINESFEPTSLLTLKLHFMRIVCSHEHFMLLNLPVDNIPTTPKDLSESRFQTEQKSFGRFPTAPASHLVMTDVGQATIDLNKDYKMKHFLLGIVLSDLACLLASSNINSYTMIISLVRSILSCHENDCRLTDKPLKHRVAALYLPLLAIVIDIRDMLHDPYKETGYAALGLSHKAVLEVSAIDVEALEEEQDKDTNPSRSFRHKPIICLNREQTKELLLCFCWVTKNVEKSELMQYLQRLSSTKLSDFVDILRLCSSCFEYKPVSDNLSSDGSSSLEDVPAVHSTEEHYKVSTLGRKQSESQMSTSIAENRAKQLEAKKDPASNTVKWRSNENLVTNYPVKKGQEEIEDCFGRHLSTEVCLNILENFNTLIQLASSASDSLNFILPELVGLLMHLLACNHSVKALENVLNALRKIITLFTDLVFEQKPELCAEMCAQLLRHLASKLPSIRSQASGTLYLLMKTSFEHSASFSKVKMQVTMSLSSLVSNAAPYGFLLNEHYLRCSLKTMLCYLEEDSSQLAKSTFSSQLKELIFNLHTILSDTVKMESFSNDFEMLIDLMYRIAKGYQNNPDLRLTWLINMANRHADRENFVEASHCFLHCAALVNEYLAMGDSGCNLPGGLDIFQQLSDNIYEESAVSDDVINPEEEGICESSHFSVEGFVHLIEKAVVFLEKGQMHELVFSLYQIILPLFDKQNDCARLIHIHHKIVENLRRVEAPLSIVQELSDPFVSPLNGSDKRCFGTYFRVGFYGYKLGDMNEEFIYKEPQITKLSEISHRLEAFYSQKFGVNFVEVVKDSNEVDSQKLNTEKVYIQVTYVEPYFDTWERRRRSTHLQRNYKLNRFTYATPFTKDGRAHGDLRDQFKRKVVLTTQHSFPYIKTRLKVVSREQVVLSPIEVAIEDIQKKTKELATAIATSPPDSKMLQMVLQGCIGTTVNAGPIQIAKVFLTGAVLNEQGKPTDQLQNKLRLCFKDFSKKCCDALYINEQIIEPERANYQRELRKNYSDFTKQLGDVLEKRATLSNNFSIAHAETLSGPATAV